MLIWLKNSTTVYFLLLLSWRLSAQARIWVNESDFWDLNTQKGIMRGQNLKMHKVNHPTNPYHTCYESTCEGKHCPVDSSATIRFCYPAVIITGLPKCATSAVYDLISKFPGAITMHEKENCPSTRRRAHWIYFNSLPKMENIYSHSIVIDGCIDITNNMKIRDLIRNPVTHYIVRSINNFFYIIFLVY